MKALQSNTLIKSAQTGDSTSNLALTLVPDLGIKPITKC